MNPNFPNYIKEVIAKGLNEKLTHKQCIQKVQSILYANSQHFNSDAFDLEFDLGLKEIVNGLYQPWTFNSVTLKYKNLYTCVCCHDVVIPYYNWTYDVELRLGGYRYFAVFDHQTKEVQYLVSNYSDDDITPLESQLSSYQKTVMDKIMKASNHIVEHGRRGPADNILIQE